MKKLIFISVLLLFAIVSFPDYKITRGPAVGEIYFIGPTYTGLGLYYSTDFGLTAICKDSLVSQNMMSIVADKTEGYIYYVSYTESIYRSSNYGQQNSWELIGGDGNLNICSGVDDGFLYVALKKHSEDYGNTFIPHQYNGFFGDLMVVEIDQNEDIGYARVKKYGIPDSIFLLISYDKFENLEILNVFHKNQTKIGWLNRGTQEGELFSLSSGMQDNEGYLSYSNDYGYSWSLLNILNIVDESIYSISGVGGKQEGEYFILITYINNMWQNANTYVLHSTDCGITLNLHHPFSKGVEPLCANFSAKKNDDKLKYNKYDSTYYITGDLPLNVQFHSYSIGDISLYEWDFDNNGTIDSFEENPVFTYTDTGWNSVNLTIYNGYDTNSFLRENYIYVDKETGVLNFNQAKINCYPNPFSDFIAITFPQESTTKSYNLEIYDISGTRVRTIITDKNEIIWNGKNENGKKCKSGIYIFNLNDISSIKNILLTH